MLQLMQYVYGNINCSTPMCQMFFSVDIYNARITILSYNLSNPPDSFTTEGQ